MHQHCVSIDIVDLEKTERVTNFQNDAIKSIKLKLEKTIHVLSRSTSSKAEEFTNYISMENEVTHDTTENNKKDINEVLK